MRLTLSTIILSLLSLTTVAQQAGFTFFSQDGDLFYVILDGIRQNYEPAANVKVTDLDRPNYKVKIIFDNPELKDINKNLIAYDMDNKPFHTVYMISKKKDGEMVMRMSSFNEVKELAPKIKESQVKYHSQEIPQQNAKTTTSSESVNVTSTGTSMKVNAGEESVSIGINLDGIKDLANVDVSTSTTTTTTTTTTTSKSSNANNARKVEDSYETPAPSASATTKSCSIPMSSSEFEDGKSSISKQSFAESQMKTAKQMTRANCLSTKQIRSIMDIFSFEENKLEYAKFAYEFCTDKKNYYQLSEAFSFSSNADSLNDFLESQH